MKEISIKTLHQALQNGTAPCVIDVREKNEWQQGHLNAQQVRHIPMGQVAENLEKLPKQVWVLCRSGGRSGQITQFLNSQGFDAKNITGGLLAWAAEIDPRFPIS